MAAKYTDQEIMDLIGERKPLPANYRQAMRVRPKRGHDERELDVQGENGHEFRIILRQSRVNPLDFSAILAMKPVDSSQMFRLRRYNGRHGEHTNIIERVTFNDYHIHTATERYQDTGTREDAFAEPTNRYADFPGAVRCLLVDCGFEAPDDGQLNLFEETEP